MSLLFLKLLLAHLLGDFVFQSNGMVQKRKEQVGYLLLHVAIHAVLLTLMFINTLPTYWSVILFVTAAHLCIDSFKVFLERQWPMQPFKLFVADQLFHLLSLIATLTFVYGLPAHWVPLLLSPASMCYIIAFVLVAFVSPIVLRVFFGKWTKEADFSAKPNSSLPDAGLLIGIMERLLIVLFIQIGFLSGIGFLLGAKSIFRFGDLTKAKDNKFTEYVLVGTFASFVMGTGIGYGLKLGLAYLT